MFDLRMDIHQPLEATGAVNFEVKVGRFHVDAGHARWLVRNQS